MRQKDLSTYISEHINRLSTKVIYGTLLLYYAYKRKETPAWAKRIIVGSIAYFLSPIDAIPDLAPFIGFTDDWSILTFGLVTIACYIDDDVRDSALSKAESWLGRIDSNEIDKVDDLL